MRRQNGFPICAKLRESRPNCPVCVLICARTRLVPADPLVEDRIGEGVQQDKDGVVGREVSLSARPVEKEMGQVVEAADHGVVHPLGGAVA